MEGSQHSDPLGLDPEEIRRLGHRAVEAVAATIRAAVNERIGRG